MIVAPSSLGSVRDVGAKALQHALGVIARRDRLDDGGDPLDVEAGEEHRRLHLRGGHRHAIGDRRHRIGAADRQAAAGRRSARSPRRPSRASGSSTRAIGRRDSEASPTKVVAKACAPAMPTASRTPVPALPKSITPSGSSSPPVPRPMTRQSAVAAALDLGAEGAHGGGGRHDVGGFEQPGDPASRRSPARRASASDARSTCRPARRRGRAAARRGARSEVLRRRASWCGAGVSDAPAMGPKESGAVGSTALRRGHPQRRLAGGLPGLRRGLTRGATRR